MFVQSSQMLRDGPDDAHTFYCFGSFTGRKVAVSLDTETDRDWSMHPSIYGNG